MGTSLSLSAPCISHCKRADGQNSINRDPFLGLRWDPFQAARMALCTVGTAVFDVVAFLSFSQEQVLIRCQGARFLDTAKEKAHKRESPAGAKDRICQFPHCVQSRGGSGFMLWSIRCCPSLARSFRKRSLMARL